MSMNCVNITNSTLCEDGMCPTVYRKVMGTLIFILVWPFIVLDMKWFPLGRPAASLAGATLMVIFSVVTPNQVYEVIGAKGNLQAVCLVMGMMLLSYYYDREGLLLIIALFIFGKNKPFRSILWKVCGLTACMAAIITNDATALIMTPLILGEHRKQGRSRKELTPLLIGIAMCANIGSAATFFGNPQNAYIAANSNGEISLILFFQTNLPTAILGVLITIGMLYVVFCRMMFGKEKKEKEEDEQAAADATEAQMVEMKFGADQSSLAASREDLARTYDQSENPNLSSQIAHERETLFHDEKHGDTLDELGINSTTKMNGDQPVHATNPVIPAKNKDETEEITVVETKSLRDRSWREIVFMVWLIFITVFMVILLTIPPPPTVMADFNLGLIPVGAAVLTMVADTLLNRKYSYDAIAKIDWGVLLMYMGLFTWLQGFDNTGFPAQLFDLIREYMNLKTVGGVIFFTVFMVIGSNLICNVPLTILVVKEFSNFICTPGGSECPEFCTIRLVGILLAWVATIAGTFTLLGSVCNLIVAEKARSITNYRLTFLRYLKFGLVSATIVVFTGLPITYFLESVAKT